MVSKKKNINMVIYVDTGYCGKYVWRGQVKFPGDNICQRGGIVLNLPVLQGNEAHNIHYCDIIVQWSPISYKNRIIRFGTFIY